MKKMFAFPFLILPFVLTSCNWSKLIDKFTPKREGVTFAEFRAAAEEADKKPRNYTGFICSGEFPDRNVYLDPTTIYFSELEEKEQNPATWQEETSIEMFKMYSLSLKACFLSPRADDDIFYIYDYGFKYLSDVNYYGYIVEFNSDGIMVDHRQGHGDDEKHVHFKWIGGPDHPTDETE